MTYDSEQRFRSQRGEPLEPVKVGTGIGLVFLVSDLTVGVASAASLILAIPIGFAIGYVICALLNAIHGLQAPPTAVPDAHCNECGAWFAVHHDPEDALDVWHCNRCGHERHAHLIGGSQRPS